MSTECTGVSSSFCALGPPALEHGVIGEAECLVAGYRNPLTQRLHRDGSRRSREDRAEGQAQQPIDIDGGADIGGAALDDGFGIAIFACRHEAEMTGLEGQSRVVRQGAETGETWQMPSRRACEQSAVAFARNPVENNSGKRRRGLMTREAVQQGGH